MVVHQKLRELNAKLEVDKGEKEDGRTGEETTRAGTGQVYVWRNLMRTRLRRTSKQVKARIALDMTLKGNIP